MQKAVRYSAVAIVLHWLIAGLMVGNVVLAWVVEDLPEAYIRFGIDTHKSIGITVLGLFVLRVLWRLGHRPPAHEAGALTPVERKLSAWVHLALYAVMLALPLSGWLHDSAWKAAEAHPMQLFGLFDWPRVQWVMQQEPVFKEHLHDLFGEAHELLASLLYGLLFLHVAGALKHQFIDKQKLLQRMWF